MLFVHSQHKEGQHNQHHTHSRYTVSGRFSEQKEKRYANKRSAREADKLPLGQIEHDLCFDFCLVLGFVYLSQCGNLLPF